MAMETRRIDEHVSVSPQIDPADVEAIKAAGFTTIVNNRPDDEEPGQPSGAAVQAAAEAAGVGYVEIPVTQAGFSGNQVAAMRNVLETSPGPVFAFCRSGTRSCNLWALARAQMGDAPNDLVVKGHGAGYNLHGLMPLLETLSGKAGG